MRKFATIDPVKFRDKIQDGIKKALKEKQKELENDLYCYDDDAYLQAHNLCLAFIRQTPLKKERGCLEDFYVWGENDNHFICNKELEYDIKTAKAVKASNSDNNKLLGLQKLPNGLIFWGAILLLENYLPAFMMLYWNGKNIRFYMPKNGNYGSVKEGYKRCGRETSISSCESLNIAAILDEVDRTFYRAKSKKKKHAKV